MHSQLWAIRYRGALVNETYKVVGKLNIKPATYYGEKPFLLFNNMNTNFMFFL